MTPHRLPPLLPDCLASAGNLTAATTAPMATPMATPIATPLATPLATPATAPTAAPSTPSLLAGLGLALACASWTSGAWAWGNLLLLDAPPAQDKLSVGVSEWLLPRSVGSRVEESWLLPAIDYERSDGWFASTDSGLGQNLSSNPRVQAGWRVWPVLGRTRSDAQGPLKAYSDRLTVQPFANAMVSDWLLAQSTLVYGSGLHHDGVSAEMGLTTGLPLGADIIGVGVAATLANAAQRRDETGVSGGGWTDWSLNLGVEHHLSSQWRLDAQLQSAWLLNTRPSGQAPYPVNRHPWLLSVSLWRDL